MRCVVLACLPPSLQAGCDVLQTAYEVHVCRKQATSCSTDVAMYTLSEVQLQVTLGSRTTHQHCCLLVLRLRRLHTHTPAPLFFFLLALRLELGYVSKVEAGAPSGLNRAERRKRAAAAAASGGVSSDGSPIAAAGGDDAEDEYYSSDEEGSDDEEYAPDQEFFSQFDDM
jgi:hypothetical protein